MGATPSRDFRTDTTEKIVLPAEPPKPALLPCPFCGAAPAVLGAYITCDKCGCSGPGCPGEFDTPEEGSVEANLAAWNKRIPQ